MSAEAHAAGVERVRAALDSVGLPVEDELAFGHPDPTPGVYPESARLTFGTGPDGGVGFVVVTTDQSATRVTGGSFEWLYDYDPIEAGTFRVDLASDPRSDLDAATNAEVARALAFRSSADTEALDRLVPPDGSYRAARLVEGLGEPELAGRESVLLALELAELAASGVPLEWAFRRVAAPE